MKENRFIKFLKEAYNMPYESLIVVFAAVAAVAAVVSMLYIVFVPTYVNEYYDSRTTNEIHYDYDPSDLVDAFADEVKTVCGVNESGLTARALKESNAVIITPGFTPHGVITGSTEGFCGDTLE